MRQCLLVFLWSLLIPAIAGAQQKRIIPAINAIEPWQQVGQQPYEMTWVQREEDPRVLVNFEDLNGWTLELYGNARGEFRRSREQQMWGEHVGKFLYAGTSSDARVIVRPPHPVPVSGLFDCVEMWGYASRWSWIKDDSTPPADLSVLVVDARGHEFHIELTPFRWKQWWLIHRRVPADIQKQMVLPVSFSGIEINKIRNQDLRYFFCDDLTFYKEDLQPLTFKSQPKRNLKPFRDQIIGTNTGPGTLPFPTREETILPSNFEKEYQVNVSQAGPDRFQLTYKGHDATVMYDYRPKTGNLNELTVRVNGGAPFRAMDGGGVRFADNAAGRLLSARLEGNVVAASFRYGSRQVDYQLRLWQKSLVLDVWCDGGEATELNFGRVVGVTNPKLIVVPYVTYGSSNPRILMSGGEAHPVFTSVWFDWYRSNGSEPYFTKTPKVTRDSGEINGGIRYIPKTDELRNNLYERIFLTNSPIYEETLPTIANPPSLRQQEGKQVLWTVTAPEDFRKDHERCLQIRSYGLDKIMQHSHEVTWRDEGDSNTMKLHASPQKGGDAMLKWYVHAQNALGWLQGVYSNYTDFCTVNTNWNPDFVTRMPDGDWHRAWPRNYLLKAAKAVEMDAYYAKRIKEKFGVKMSYTDVHTAVPPWRCDYDARVPGAGTFASTFYAYGQLLRNDQQVYGPTQSEGTYQWLYAGLTSGKYGWVYTDVNLLTHPLDVSFMLYKIHPLECDYGMGYTFYYLQKMDPNWSKSPKRRDYVDLFLATTIGYGNMGWLVTDFQLSTPFGVETMARSYYMMQQLQQQFAFVTPKLIEYADRRGRFLSPSLAHATGAIADSRLHVVYQNGTEVYVNRSSAGDWSVRDAEGKTVDLPVSGWLAFNRANHFYEVSGRVKGRRIDYVSAGAYEFLDGRGQWTQHGDLGATGSVALRHRTSDVLELIDIYGNDRIAFRAPANGTLEAYDPDGKSLGKVRVSSGDDGWLQFKPLAGARSYVYGEKK